jgi:ferrous iron transport protein B
MANECRENINTINALAVGASGVIMSLSGERGEIRRRLIDMGLTPGTKVTLVKAAPMGDPLEVSLRGYELSLRRADAARIEIKSLGEGEEPPRAQEVEVDSKAKLRMSDAHIHERREHQRPYDPSEHDKHEWKVALAGNPNCGKTTLFNALTGSNQYVGNWAGVTVEKKEGQAKLGDKSMTIVDLPGIYSLSPYSMEEIVARDFIIGEHPDAIIDIVDATNLERNLYLTTQLLELERPMVVALNFMDEVEKHGDKIDVEKLSSRLGVPVIPISARDGTNLDTLLAEAHRQMHTGLTVQPDDLYDDFTHEIHHRVGELIHDKAYAAGIPAHWAAIKLIEGDPLVEKTLGLGEVTKQRIEQIATEYEAASPLGDRETLIADSRYRFIEQAVRGSIKRAERSGETLTDRIDAIATNKILAFPVFLGLMLIMFWLTFGPIGSTLSDLLAAVIEKGLSPAVNSAMTAAGAAEWARSLVVDGVIAGVGGVVTFLPMIALLFLCLSFLEDSGYMARAAFVMDRTLRHFGLSGKAFIPMLMGFGCTVPAVMGARTMENEKDRRMTIMLVPFMSCSARLPIYGLLAGAFFSHYRGLVVASVYIIGVSLAIISGLLLKRALFRGEPAAFLLELPPYRMPTIRNISLHVWEKVRDFLTRAATIILAMSVVVWLLQNFDLHMNMVGDVSQSMLAAFGGAIAPIFAPMGFGVWQAAVALLTGLVAKEAVVSSMSLFYGFSLTASGASVALALGGTFSPAAAFAFIVFCGLYTPCVAAIATIRREMNSLKWTLACLGWQLMMAYIATFIVYRIAVLVI